MNTLGQYSDQLTNEILSRQCISQFDLVGKAIHIADYLIRSGKVPEKWSDNVASGVLKMMAEKGISETEKELL